MINDFINLINGFRTPLTFSGSLFNLYYIRGTRVFDFNFQFYFDGFCFVIYVKLNSFHSLCCLSSYYFKNQAANIIIIVIYHYYSHNPLQAYHIEVNLHESACLTNSLIIILIS